jgi:hypothetical protein
VSEDTWDIADATNEVVHEILEELVDDEGFIDRVLYFAEVDYTKEHANQIKLTLARIIGSIQDNY